MRWLITKCQIDGNLSSKSFLFYSKSKTSDFLFDFDQDSNPAKRRRGANNTNNNKKQPHTNHETTIRNRLFTAALFDTDHEDESAKERATTAHYDHLDEETLDDQYIDIDEDSTTQHSTNQFAPTTYARANNNNLADSDPDLNYNNNNSNTDSSDYSDWAEEDGKKCLKPPPRKTPPKPQQQQASRSERSRRRLKIQDDDLDESSAVQVDDESQSNTKTTAAVASTSRSRRASKKVLLSDDEEAESQEEEMEEDGSNEEYSSADEVDETEAGSRPCTSQSVQRPRRGRRRRQGARGKVAGKVSRHVASVKGTRVGRSKVRPAGRLAAAGGTVLKECPVEYRPPEWLTSTKPKKSPYLPQMGDEVVYFRQGHELYVKAVREAGAYELDKEVMPWETHEIDVMEYCKVRRSSSHVIFFCLFDNIQIV